MEIQLSISAAGDAMSAAEITTVAQGLVDKMRKRHLPIMSDATLRKAATEAVGRWVTHSNSSKLTKEVKQKAANKLITRVVALFTKGGAPKKAGVKQPAGFSAPDGTKAKAKKFSKDEIEKIADRLSYKVQFGKSKNKVAAIKDVVEEWASLHSVQYPNQSRLLSKDAVTKALTALMDKKSAAVDGKKAPVKAPTDKVVPTTKAATKEEKQKAQILAATKLRNQFQGMLVKAPAMTAKSIENIRKHCDAYSRVITSVQKGNEALAETTKIEGLRGIESVKNYVNNVLGMTYGYVEFAKVMAGTQADFKARVMNRLKPEEMTKVELRRKAKENAQFALMNFTKQLGKRQCRVPPKFTTDMQRIFSTAVESGDFKAAKAEARALFDTLVADVFSNKVKMYSGK